jgi:hypothetical protein
MRLPGLLFTLVLLIFTSIQPAHSCFCRWEPVSSAVAEAAALSQLSLVSAINSSETKLALFNCSRLELKKSLSDVALVDFSSPHAFRAFVFEYSSFSSTPLGHGLLSLCAVSTFSIHFLSRNSLETLVQRNELTTQRKQFQRSADELLSIVDCGPASLGQEQFAVKSGADEGEEMFLIPFYQRLCFLEENLSDCCMVLIATLTHSIPLYMFQTADRRDLSFRLRVFAINDGLLLLSVEDSFTSRHTRLLVPCQAEMNCFPVYSATRLPVWKIPLSSLPDLDVSSFQSFRFDPPLIHAGHLHIPREASSFEFASAADSTQ